jgi:hypothetical protein
MISAIFGIVITAAIGSLTVPVMMLALARLGYFEPIRFHAFGHAWNFSPKKPLDHVGGAIVLTFPFQRQTVFASAATAAYTVAAPFGVIDGTQHLKTGAMMSGHVQDVRGVA